MALPDPLRSRLERSEVFRRILRAELMAEPLPGVPQATWPAFGSCLEFGPRRSWSPPGSASRSKSPDQRLWIASSRELTGPPLCAFFPKGRGGRREGSLPHSPGGTELGGQGEVRGGTA